MIRPEDNDKELLDDDIDLIIGEVKKVKVRGRVYKVSAASISELKLLGKLIGKIHDIDLDVSGKEEELIPYELKVTMAKIIKMGIKRDHPDITIEEIMDEFPLSSFPVIFKIMLDLNDFLSEMEGVKRLQLLPTTTPLSSPVEKMLKRKGLKN